MFLSVWKSIIINSIFITLQNNNQKLEEIFAVPTKVFGIGWTIDCC